MQCNAMECRGAVSNDDASCCCCCYSSGGGSGDGEVAVLGVVVVVVERKVPTATDCRWEEGWAIVGVRSRTATGTGGWGAPTHSSV